jgi:hypothetical protein
MHTALSSKSRISIAFELLFMNQYTSLRDVTCYFVILCATLALIFSYCLV